MGVNPLEIQRKSYKWDKSRSISNEILNVGFVSHRKNVGNMEPQEFNESEPRISKCRECDLDS